MGNTHEISIRIKPCCKAITNYGVVIKPFLSIIDEEGFATLRVFLQDIHHNDFPLYYCPACGKEFELEFKTN